MLLLAPAIHQSSMHGQGSAYPHTRITRRALLRHMLPQLPLRPVPESSRPPSFYRFVLSGPRLLGMSWSCSSLIMPLARSNKHPLKQSQAEIHRPERLASSRSFSSSTSSDSFSLLSIPLLLKHLSTQLRA